MDYRISFKKMTELAMEILSKQPIISLEDKRKQFKELKKAR